MEEEVDISLAIADRLKLARAATLGVTEIEISIGVTTRSE